MSKPYNPTDWYWIVDGDETVLYSSKAGDYVQPDDAAYVAWAADGTMPTRIASEDELGGVLASYALPPVPSNVLDSYKDVLSRELPPETVAKLLLALTNEVRTLKGQAEFSAAEFRDYIKGLV